MKTHLVALCALLSATVFVSAAPKVTVSATAPNTAFAPLVADPFPLSALLNRPLVAAFTGTAPVNIHWLRVGPPTWQREEIAAARGAITFTPTTPGWYMAFLWNEQTPDNTFGYGGTSFGLRWVNGTTTGWLPWTSSAPTGWTFVE